MHKRDHKFLTWLLSSASPHSPRATSINLVDLVMFRMYSQINFQLSFYLNLLRILISSSLLVSALSHPKYHSPFLIWSHNSHSLPLLISVSEELNEMTIYFHTQTRTLLRVKEGSIKNYAQTTGKNWDCNRQPGHTITLKLSKVRRFKRDVSWCLGSWQLETRSMLP